MEKFIKSYNSFLESKNYNTEDEVQATTKEILNNEFDKVRDVVFKDDTVTFKVSPLDFDTEFGFRQAPEYTKEDEEELQLGLGSGSMKKRKVNVFLTYLDGNPPNQLTYSIRWENINPEDYKKIKIEDDDDEFIDEYEEEERRRLKEDDVDITKHVNDIDDLFSTGNIEED